jgi:hypothetical protein
MYIALIQYTFSIHKYFTAQNGIKAYTIHGRIDIKDALKRVIVEEFISVA